jgi:predicted AlkP superfamily phosphohydrolase/phosphomutase
MGPHHGLAQAVEPVLERAGWLERSAPGVPARLRALGLARRSIRALVPARARPALARLVPRDRLVAELSLADVDWSRTRAFQLPSDGGAFIRLNLAGREPAGTVVPGEGYDRACAELIELFESLRVAGAGEPAVVEAVRVDELLGAPVDGPLPDVCVRWARLRDIHAVNAAGLGTVEFARTDPRTSGHWEPGFVAMAGPGVPPSGDKRLEGPDARLVDFAATVFQLLGVAQPDALTGTPIAYAEAPH